MPKKRKMLKLGCKNHLPFFLCLSSNSVNRKRNDPHLPVPELVIHASMYGVADKYGIQGLKSISTQKLKAALQHKAWIPDSQQRYPSNMMQEFAAAVKAVWNLTPDSDKGVRAPLLEYALKNKDTLLEAEGLKFIIQQTPQFACDLIAHTFQH